MSTTQLDQPIEQEIAEPFRIPEYDQDELEALEFINGVRAWHQQAPLEHLPAGVPDHVLHCVVARALHTRHHLAYVYEGEVEFRTRTNWLLHKLGFMGKPTAPVFVPSPGALHFIAKFDAGQYPHLVRREAPTWTSR